MSITFQKAQRGNIGLLLMLAGGTGAGKSYSAMALAKGMAGGQRFAYCDTERGRASIYADTFDFDVFELSPPFTPERYQEVVEAAENNGYPVLVIDSMSHEWEGAGGLLEQHTELMGGQESKNLSAWIKPKMAHRKFVNYLLQAKPHVIMCFRAAERVEAERDAKGKLKVVPKKSLTGLNGWLPITEKTLPFEATASFMLMADRPGIPLAIKLPEPLRPLIPLDAPLAEATGAALARWAAGGASAGALSPEEQSALDAETQRLVERVLSFAADDAKRAEMAKKVEQVRRKLPDPGAFMAWLGAQIDRLEAKAAEREQEPLETAS